ncbi:tRNA (N6-threonylcarbamoyladenosine(37)-N6)-methyltransferase TrmO [Planctomycetota bacterium]
MKYKAIMVITFCCVLFCGCEEYEYTVKMEFEGDSITREIRCSENTPEQIYTKLNKLYDKQIDKNTFKGSFGKNLPDDVGGFGQYVYHNNPMGHVYIYVERFRGKDDQALEIEKAFKDSNRLVDLLIVWLQMELGDNPNFGKLRIFCDEKLREDIKNLSMYCWVGDRVSREPDEAFIRIFLYLYERGYLTFDDIMSFSTSINKQEFALSYFRRLITDKLEYTDEKDAEKELVFLQDPYKLMESLNRFFSSPELYDRLTKEAREITGIPHLILDPCDIPHMVDDMPGTLFDIFFLDLFRSSGDKINVKLIYPRKPYETNGQWDERTAELCWSRNIRSEQLPFVCYAAIGMANDTFQQDHFGKVIFQDEKLVQYSFWYKGLSSEQRTEWDDHILSLDGDDENVWSKVESFRFKHAPPPYKDPDGVVVLLSDLPRDLIKQGLDMNKKQGQELNGLEGTRVQKQSFATHAIGKVVKEDGRCYIVLNDEYQAGLKGLEKHSYVTVVYWFDKNDTPEKRGILEVHPRGDKNNPLTGVFATHSPFRPNLIGITKCDIIEVKKNIIEIKDIDAFDGSPVLDLKGDFFRFHESNTE